MTKINLSAQPRRSQELAETGNKGRKKIKYSRGISGNRFPTSFQAANCSIEDDIINQPGRWGKMFAVNDYANH